MSTVLLQADGLVLSFGGRALIDHAGMIIHEGDRIALVGRNGSGKSTLMKMLAGQTEPQEGTLFIQPGTMVRYLAQDPDLTMFDRADEAVQAGLGAYGDMGEAERLIDQLGIVRDQAPSAMSGGERRRVALAQALASRPDLLLLDEPTNHLDLPSIEWLEQALARFRGAVMLISHDRRFLENVTRRTLWLDRGDIRALEDGFGAFEAWRDRLIEEEELDAHKLKRKIAREEDWVVHGVSGRRKRNMRRLGELQDLRKAYREREKVQGNAVLEVATASPTGRKVIEAEKLVKAYGAREVVDGFSIRVQRGDRIGFVGANGSGKSTLVNLLIGELEADHGTITIGTGVELARFDQLRTVLDGSRTLGDYLTDGRGDTLLVNGAQRHVTGYMKDFLFRPEQARTPISALSGGEQARLILARLFARPSNLLVLDEPTNDLDMETLDLLEEVIATYDGTVLLVSHDRDFLDRTVTSLIVAEGDGRFTTYAGGWSDMLAQRGGSPFQRRAVATDSGRKVVADKPKSKPAQKLSY